MNNVPASSALHKPVSAEYPSPFSRSVGHAQGCQFASQATDLWNPVQAQELAELTWCLVWQPLGRFDPAQRHVGEQNDHVQRGVVTGQSLQAIMDMSKQTILRQCRQGTKHAAEGNVAAGFKAVGPLLSNPKAARTRSSGRVHPVPFGHGILDGRVDCPWRQAAVKRSLRRSWFLHAESTPAQSIVLVGSPAERIGLEASSVAVSDRLQPSAELPGSSRHFLRHHRGTARTTRRKERLGSARTKRLDARAHALDRACLRFDSDWRVLDPLLGER